MIRMTNRSCTMPALNQLPSSPSAERREKRRRLTILPIPAVPVIVGSVPLLRLSVLVDQPESVNVAYITSPVSSFSPRICARPKRERIEIEKNAPGRYPRIVSRMLIIKSQEHPARHTTLLARERERGKAERRADEPVRKAAATGGQRIATRTRTTSEVRTLFWGV